MSEILDNQITEEEEVVSADTPQPEPKTDDIQKEQSSEAPITTNVKTEKKKQNVKTERKVFIPTEDNDVVYEDSISIPSDSYENTIENISNSDKIKLEDTKEKRRWANVIKEGLDQGTTRGTFDSVLREDTSDFTNQFVVDGKMVGVKTPTINNSGNTGERAILRAAQELGMGTLKTIPLFNSGFHLILKPYTDTELIELNIKIAENKISLGSQTKGLVYSSTTYYAIECIMDFIKNHIYNTTLKLNQDENILDYVVSQDISDLLWGILLTSNPSGYKYERACTYDPSTCNYIETGLLRLQEIQYVNRNALTDWQKSFMTRLENRSKTKEEVLRYQKELACMSQKSVLLTENGRFKVYIVLKAPTVNEYINSSRKWVTEISDKINEMFSNASESDRDSFMLDSGRSSTIRQYCHYVDHIVEVVQVDEDNTEENIINDRETVENYLSFISDAKIINKFFEIITDYISKSTVTVLGVPVYNCSSCKNPQTKDTDIYDPVFSEIVPLDMLTYFFSHLTQRTSRIRHF